MKASEFISRLQELMDYHGDVEVVIGVDGGEDQFERAAAETQSVTSDGAQFATKPTGNNQWVIKVW